MNATVTQYTSSVDGVSLPTDWPHGTVTVHRCTVWSPLTGCQVTSRSRDRFSRYLKMAGYYPDSSRRLSIVDLEYSKEKCNFVQALRSCTGRTTHRGSRGIALLFLDHGTRRGEGSASHPGRSLLPGKTRYPL